MVALTLFIAQLLYMVESPTWAARKGLVDRAAASMSKIYGEKFSAAPVEDRSPIVNQATKGFANIALIFRGGIYLPPRTILAATIQIGQSIQYFAVAGTCPSLA